MNLQRKSIRIGKGQVRHSTRVEGEDCEMGSLECWFHQQELLRSIVATPDLIFCGSSRAHKISIFHDGTRWVAQAEAVVNE